MPSGRSYVEYTGRLALACWFCLGAGATFGESRVTGREGPSGDVLELEGQTQGQIVKHSLPLYRTGAIRYFSAGVGSEERQAEGPWLFVDLPSGMYDISASYGEHKHALKGIKVVAGRQKTIHMRWADEAGALMKVPPQ
jgi:hypothetical protein